MNDLLVDILRAISGLISLVLFILIVVKSIKLRIKGRMRYSLLLYAFIITGLIQVIVVLLGNIEMFLPLKEIGIKYSGNLYDFTFILLQLIVLQLFNEIGKDRGDASQH